MTTESPTPSSDSSVRESAPSSFDSLHPPEQDKIDACVHCGFCLSTCPSYRVLGTETDSPRGRIYLMDALANGEISLTPEVVQHFDSCLGCLACVSTCPSGVQYDQLIADMRAQVARNHPRSLSEKALRWLVFNLFPYPNRLRPLLRPLQLAQKLRLTSLVRRSGILKRLSPQLASMEAILPVVPGSAFSNTLPTEISAQGQRRFRVGMVLGCVQQVLFDEVNQATARVLSANGCDVVIPPHQGCCAALPYHQGEEAQAAVLARQMIDCFEGENLDAVVINAAGCGHTLKEYGRILRDDPEYAEKAENFSRNVKDIQEFLADVGLTVDLTPLHSDPLTLVYQDACHLLHGQQISAQPRQLLRGIPGVSLRDPADASLCCGSAGVFNIFQPDIAEDLGRQKIRNLLATGAVAIASANPGCALQIQKHLREEGHNISVYHPIQLLDWSISGQPIPEV
ncbi:MAG: heterodisulfide reductase-related iron-sulfur binding cluster [Cyanobacteria bacterium P01_E01_bin.34]